MCPDAPSAQPSLAKVRKAAAMCCFAQVLSASLSVKEGMTCRPSVLRTFQFSTPSSADRSSTCASGVVVCVTVVELILSHVCSARVIISKQQTRKVLLRRLDKGIVITISTGKPKKVPSAFITHIQSTCDHRRKLRVGWSNSPVPCVYQSRIEPTATCSFCAFRPCPDQADWGPDDASQPRCLWVCAHSDISSVAFVCTQ